MSGWPMGKDKDEKIKENKSYLPYPLNMQIFSKSNISVLLSILIMILAITGIISSIDRYRVKKRVAIFEQIVYSNMKINKSLLEIVKTESDMIQLLNQRIRILEGKVKKRIYYKPDYLL